MFSLSKPLLQAKENVISRSSSIAPEYTYYHPMVTSSPVFHIVPSIGIVTSRFIMNKELVVTGLDHCCLPEHFRAATTYAVATMNRMEVLGRIFYNDESRQKKSISFVIPFYNSMCLFRSGSRRYILSITF